MIGKNTDENIHIPKLSDPAAKSYHFDTYTFQNSQDHGVFFIEYLQRNKDNSYTFEKNKFSKILARISCVYTIYSAAPELRALMRENEYSQINGEYAGILSVMIDENEIYSRYSKSPGNVEDAFGLIFMQKEVIKNSKALVRGMITVEATQNNLGVIM